MKTELIQQKALGNVNRGAGLGREQVNAAWCPTLKTHLNEGGRGNNLTEIVIITNRGWYMNMEALMFPIITLTYLNFIEILFTHPSIIRIKRAWNISIFSIFYSSPKYPQIKFSGLSSHWPLKCGLCTETLLKIFLGFMQQTHSCEIISFTQKWQNVFSRKFATVFFCCPRMWSIAKRWQSVS